MKAKIKFKKATSPFYAELREEVKLLLTEKVIRKANRLLIIKFISYTVIFLLLYGNLFNPYMKGKTWAVILNYTLLGLTGILLAFNCSHDCVHNTFSKYKKMNQFIYYITFNLQGVNARLWRKRHITSHHVFPNVDGCDADIDDNIFIRLSAHHPIRNIHQYQHFYATLLYCFYTLHWIFIKDFIYLRKKELGNLRNQNHSWKSVVEVVVLKLAYFTYMLVLPAIFTGIPGTTIMISFLIMHLTISLFFVLTLIISHLSLETDFPIADENGCLPYDYYEHQLAVSLDYHPTNPLANWIFGGFNSHAAHHLFPGLPHTLYTIITPAIKKAAVRNNFPYHEKSIAEAVISHYQYLWKLSK
ncbi:fatty acid desaturase family protein [Chryseobacterium sp. JK1]|uniref:fatty acid desaturase family protein n=1 Tax=Chryseobacterium sp. JK1 TaxID=874294 RepID=UPI003D68C5A3